MSVLHNAPVAAESRSPAWTAGRRILREPRFVVAAIILLVCAVGLNAATEFMRLHFRKESVALPIKALDDPAEGIPARMGPWLQVSVDEPLSGDIEHELGTHAYVFRDYVDTRVLTTAGTDFHKDLAPKDRAALLNRAQNEHPEAVIRMAVTYYTGLVDTVSHIPERCYVADGFEPSSPERIGGIYKNADGEPRDIAFRFIGFDDQTGKSRGRHHVGYFFQVNGRYESDPLEVRKRLQDLLERYGYYAKVELMTSATRGEIDNAKAAGVMKDFLISALPEIEKRLPDWRKLKGA